MSEALANPPINQIRGTLPVLMNGTYNIHIAMVVRLIDRAILEVVGSQSAPGPGMRSADALRISQYVKELRSFISYSSKLPETDTVKSYPIPVPFDLPVVLPRIENDSMWLLAQMLDTLRIEVGNSASARIPNGWWAPDLPRTGKMLDDVDRFMAEHVAKATPSDYPESSPRDLVLDRGRMGA